MEKEAWKDLTFEEVRKKYRDFIKSSSYPKYPEWEQLGFLDKIPLGCHNDETAIVFETSMLKHFSLKTSAFLALLRATMDPVQLIEDDPELEIYLVIYTIAEVEKILGDDFNSVLEEAEKSWMFHYWVSPNGLKIIFGLSEKTV